MNKYWHVWIVPSDIVGGKRDLKVGVLSNEALNPIDINLLKESTEIKEYLLSNTAIEVFKPTEKQLNNFYTKLTDR